MMSSLAMRAAWLLLASSLVAAPVAASVAASPPVPAPRSSTAAIPSAVKQKPTVQFVTGGQRVMDRAGKLRVVVELSGPAKKHLAIPFSVSGSAQQGADIRVDTWRIPVLRGEVRGELVLDVMGRQPGAPIAGSEYEHGFEKTFTLTLVSTKGVRLGEQKTHTIALGNTQLGDPLTDLTPDELAAFNRGRLVFERRFKPSEGLGPFYNATSCKSCHSTPVPGGASSLYRNFYLGVYQFGSTPFSQSTAIPPFLSQVVPAFGSGDQHSSSTFTLEGGRPLIPETVFGFPVISAQRNSIPIFGTGLFEFVSDVTIMANADPGDSNNDGISGQINTQLGGTAVGRFGTKAQVNNIELFTRGPLMSQMGITSEPFEGSAGIVSLLRRQVSADPNEPTLDNDGVSDPEISRDDLGDLIAFTRFLAPPMRRPFSGEAFRGEAFFGTAGCTGCHVPNLPSTRGTVDAYTDLLLHDMGAELVDNIKLGDAFTALTEFRTQPLWGISMVGPYLHDGRAATLTEAIGMHGGEAQASRDAYLALPQDRRDAIIAFLEHL
jgi:CxxC motif-containing protein (DUF1111 family)